MSFVLTGDMSGQQVCPLKVVDVEACEAFEVNVVFDFFDSEGEWILQVLRGEAWKPFVDKMNEGLLHMVSKVRVVLRLSGVVSDR